MKVSYVPKVGGQMTLKQPYFGAEIVPSRFAMDVTRLIADLHSLMR